MNVHINEFKRKTQIKLRNLQNKNRKEHWWFLNSLDKKNETSDINLDTLYSFFFKDLNADYEHTNASEFDIHIDEASNERLNLYNTENEILICI